MGIPKLNGKLFKTGKKKEITSYELITQILPPFSAKFKNKSFGDKESKKTSNNIIEIKNGKYLRGQMDKSTFGGSNGLIQSIFNDFGFAESSDFIDNLQSIINEYMKTSAYSVGISDLINCMHPLADWFWVVISSPFRKLTVGHLFFETPSIVIPNSPVMLGDTDPLRSQQKVA